MATPVRRTRLRNQRPFDLRSTALFFGLLAAVVGLVGLAARTALGVVERRPAWAVVLGALGVTAVLVLRQRRRHPFSVARTVRQATAALDEATRTAIDALDHASPPRPEPGVPFTTVALLAPAGRAGAQEPPADHRDVEATVTLTPGAVTEAPATEAVDYGALDPDEFERAIAALCERDGCARVEVVGGAGDLGADVVATAPDGRRLVIQCKRYGDSNRVGSQDLQRFGGTCFTVHEADLAVVVTTSGFTAPAREYAEQCGIVCWDREDLEAWSDGTGPEPWRASTDDGEVR
ncbi:restriction endonuclease [Streptomyces sp. NPDC047079]|uniref:restriction endonuclease n=1 Tax=Streptomyces sp. NPDC047079 TaxID=3154607 RepID=UPI0033FB9095